MQTKIIDFHSHAFPDQVAVRAIPALENAAGVNAFHDGRIASLLATMDQSGIEKSVVCSIATKPEQFQAILNWSMEIRSSRLIPFPSVHPADPEVLSRIETISKAGFKGIKMHPYYQQFTLDEERMWPIYEQIAAHRLILVMHTGFDIAFAREPIASPDRIARVIKKFPHLKLIATHLGAWEQWEEVEATLAGKELYIDISYALGQVEKSLAKKIITSHPAEFILFGSDSPWADQGQVVEELLSLELPATLNEKILWQNGIELLAKEG